MAATGYQSTTERKALALAARSDTWSRGTARTVTGALVADEYGAQVHEACLQLTPEEEAKYLTRDAHGNLIYC